MLLVDVNQLQLGHVTDVRVSVSRHRQHVRYTLNQPYTHFMHSRSQCSTVMRNTVVRATIKVNGKPPILGTRSPQTPESINLKFDLDDYVDSLTLRAKIVQIGPVGSAGQRGEI